jgi:hypothetical protein
VCPQMIEHELLPVVYPPKSTRKTGGKSPKTTL